MMSLKQELFKGRYILVNCHTNKIKAFITTRSNGYSTNEYHSFNLAHHVGDDINIVKRNRELLLEDFQLKKVCFMEQTHSSEVLIVDKSNIHHDIFHADGLVSSLNNVALAIMSADCLPLLLWDDKSGVVASIHCGWRGLHRGIVGNALNKMQDIGANLININAYLGPAIGPKSFEVGSEVKEHFVKLDDKCAQAFIKGNKVDKYLCNIYELCTILLLKANFIGTIYKDHDYDTFKQQDLFYSYRRSNTTGRIASVIYIDN